MADKLTPTVPWGRNLPASFFGHGLAADEAVARFERCGENAVCEERVRPLRTPLGFFRASVPRMIEIAQSLRRRCALGSASIDELVQGQAERRAAWMTIPAAAAGRTVEEPASRMEMDASDITSGALFTREDCLEAAWAVIDPVLTEHHRAIAYPSGSLGPKAADALIASDLDDHIAREFGDERPGRYREIFEALRVELGDADNLGELQRYRLGAPNHPRLLQMSAFLLDYRRGDGPSAP